MSAEAEAKIILEDPLHQLTSSAEYTSIILYIK